MNGEIQEMLKVLKQVRNLLLTQFLTSLAADREFATNWLYSDDISIDTGDIPPTTAIQINFPVPEGKINTAEKIKWKLDEWWTTNIEWYRDGVKVYEENNAVDGETNVRIIPARDLTSVNITNTSTTTSVKVKIEKISGTVAFARIVHV